MNFRCFWTILNLSHNVYLHSIDDAMYLMSIYLADTLHLCTFEMIWNDFVVFNTNKWNEFDNEEKKEKKKGIYSWQI